MKSKSMTIQMKAIVATEQYFPEVLFQYYDEEVWSFLSYWIYRLGLPFGPFEFERMKSLGENIRMTQWALKSTQFLSGAVC